MCDILLAMAKSGLRLLAPVKMIHGVWVILAWLEQYI